MARWYEFERRFTTERNIYERALAILARHAPENDLRLVGPLRGISRAYRLEAFYGVEGGDTGASFNTGGVGAPVFSDGTTQRRGETALSTALAVIETHTPVNHRLRGEVLAELGDWYLVSNASRRAFDTYAEAWKALASAGHTGPLEVPRVLAIRPSISSVGRSALDPAESVVKTVEMHFTVDRDGRVEDVTSPTTDVPESIVRGCTISMKRARYAPRIENGAAVPTQNVVFFEKVLVKATSPDTATPSDSAGESAEEPAGATVEETPQAPREAQDSSPPPPADR
jgi:hypothetical protein